MNSVISFEIYGDNVSILQRGLCGICMIEDHGPCPVTDYGSGFGGAHTKDDAIRFMTEFINNLPWPDQDQQKKINEERKAYLKELVEVRK